MKLRLIVMRHAKSSWKSDAPTDHKRPLNKRGRRDAPRMAKVLWERGWWPDLVLSSDSERTRQTWSAMSALTDAPTAVSFTNALYLAGMDEISEACRVEATATSTVLVLGHNPGWEDAASWMCGQDIMMTTANCVLLTRECAGWGDAFARPGSWELVAHLRPKDFEEE